MPLPQILLVVFDGYRKRELSVRKDTELSVHFEDSVLITR